MKISVVLPCFNGAKTIAIQLEALTKQQWSEPWEVVVVNNGSTDNSMAIVEQYRDRLTNYNEFGVAYAELIEIPCYVTSAIQLAPALKGDSMH